MDKVGLVSRWQMIEPGGSLGEESQGARSLGLNREEGGMERSGRKITWEVI